MLSNGLHITFAVSAEVDAGPLGIVVNVVWLLNTELRTEA